MATVVVRDYKPCPLEGGTLLVSVPQFGIGSVLLTDHILDVHKMDQVAALDSDSFPPIAMVRHGKSRYPVRIHADPHARLAVLRSEVPQPPHLARATAQAILRWAKEHGVDQVIALDNMAVQAEPGAPPRAPIEGVASDDEARKRLRAIGIGELDDVVLGGILGMLTLEARFEGVKVIGLVAEVHSALDEAEGLLSFADALPKLVPGLRLDLKRLQNESRTVAETMRTLQAEIERTLRKMQPLRESEGPSIYG